MRVRAVAVVCTLGVLALPGLAAFTAERDARARGVAWCTSTGADEAACTAGAGLHHRVCSRMIWGRAGPPAEAAPSSRADYAACILQHPNRYARILRLRSAGR